MATKDRVIDAAIDLAGHEAGTFTVRELSAASGVSVGSIYHHFESLDGVLDEVRNRLLSPWVDGFTRALATDEPGPGPLAAAYRFHVRWLRSHPGTLDTMTAAANARVLGPRAAEFGLALGSWIRRQGVVDARHQRLAGAIVLGPIMEVSRQHEHLGLRLEPADVLALARAVHAGVSALARPS
jgi:AcrR family transcriptional regulator